MIKLFQAFKRMLIYTQRNQTFSKEAKLSQPQHDYIFPWLYRQ